MFAMRAARALGLCLAGSVTLHAGTIPVPADVSVSLTAEPNNNLESGQRITFTFSVTNHGPEPATPVSLGSSPIYDELDVLSATTDCGNALALAVVDLNDGFYYVYDWFPTDESPLAVGETRSCHLNLEFTEWAPDVFSLTFSMPDFLVDLDPSNNSATVTLRRASQVSATSVPTLSPLGLVILAGLLVFFGSTVRRVPAKCESADVAGR
jgi:hypothetical protein